MSIDFMKDSLSVPGPHLVIAGGVHGAGKSSLCAELAEAWGWPWLTNQVIRREHPNGKALSRGEVHGILRARVDEHTSAAQPFVFEHVMSGHYVDKLIDLADKHDFKTHLIYMDLRDAALSFERVDARKAQGGHDVEREKIEARLAESRANFWQRYRARATSWYLFDNSGPERRLLARHRAGQTDELDPGLQRFIRQAST